MNTLHTNTLYILSGLPGVGKSTFLENLKSKGLPENAILSSDKIREQLLGFEKSFDEYGEYSSLSQDVNPLVFDIINKTLEFRMSEGLTTFVDSTALTDEFRGNYIKLAQKHNVEFEVLIFDRDINDIKESNKNREKRVPESVIDRMNKDFDRESKFKHRLIYPFDNFKIESKFKIKDEINLVVIGDVHGLYEDLEKLLKKQGFFIENNCIFHNDNNSKILFVGDVVDRAYDSIKTLELIKNSVKYQDHYMVIGNHEQKLINTYDKFTNNEATHLFEASEAVTRTFHEFLELSKNDQVEYIDFLKSLPHYHIHKDKLIVHANIENGNILNLTRQQAIYGSDNIMSDVNFTSLKNGSDNRYNQYNLIRGHIPLLDHEAILKKKPDLAWVDTSAVICLEEEAINKGYLCAYDTYSNEIVREKTSFNYTRDLAVYDGKKLLNKLEELKSYQLPVYNKLNEQVGTKVTPLISYKSNDTETLRIYKYGKKVFFNNLWHLNPLLNRARGLVLDANGQIIQHPFTKVFNFNENGSGLDIPNDKKVIAATKENGFLGCITKWNNELLITTTGSFDSDFTNYIKDFIMNKNFEHYESRLYSNLMKYLSNNDQTLMFEVIHPSDPHIIKYESHEMGLKLIGARGKGFEDKELPEEKLDEIGKLINVKRPPWFEIEYGTLKDLVRDSNLEGYMVRDIDSQDTLLKFKTPYYLTTKFIGRMSASNINFMYSNPNKFKENVDEEYYDLVDLITTSVSKEDFLSHDSIEKISIVRDLINNQREELEKHSEIQQMS